MPRVAERFDSEMLHSLRLVRCMSRRQLADATGCGQRQIAAYENGQVPEPLRLAQLAHVLEVSPLELIGPPPYALSELRRAAGKTAEEAADALKMSRTTYRQLERDGVRNRSNRQLPVDLVELFQVPRIVVMQAMDRSEAVRRRRADAGVVLAELAEMAASPNGDVELRRGDARLSAVARGLDYPVDVVRPVLVAALRQIRADAAADIGAAAVNQWRGRDIPDEDRREHQVLQRRKEMLQRTVLRDLSSGVLSGAEWNALIKAISVPTATGIFPEKMLTTTTRESLLRRGFIQPVPIQPALPGDGEDPRGNFYTSTAAGIGYWQRSRYRHRIVHPHINSNVPRSVEQALLSRARTATRPQAGAGSGTNATYPG